MEKMQTFSPHEVCLLLCGEQMPSWTKDDILNYTEPKFGYTRNSPGFIMFVEVLTGMTSDERKVAIVSWVSHVVVSNICHL